MSIMAAINKIDTLLAARSLSYDGLIRDIRHRLEMANKTVSSGTGAFDALQVLDSLAEVLDSWYTDIEVPARGSAIEEVRALTDIYVGISESQSPLKNVRDSIHAYDAPLEAYRLDYWCDDAKEDGPENNKSSERSGG